MNTKQTHTATAVQKTTVDAGERDRTQRTEGTDIKIRKEVVMGDYEPS